MAAFDEPRQQMNAEQFRLLKDLMHDSCGMVLREDLKFVAERRLWPRLEALGLSDFGGYQRYLRFDPRGNDELELATELLMPHETYFFREPAQLHSFVEELCPLLHRQRIAPRRLRLWSAGCSTGEEPYTLSMLLEESGLFEGWDVEIHGTDLSRRVLATARRAEYGPSALRGTSAERLARHFEPLPGGRVRVREKLRSRVSFGHLNLIAPGAGDVLPSLDVIICRNVLIYFDAQARRQVVRALYDRLAEGGYLLLGHSESLLTTSTDFELVQLAGDLVYRRPRAP